MAEYIEKNATIKDLELLAKYQYGERQQGILGVCETIKRKPAADVVSRVAFEQIMWERDQALHQLEEHGLTLGCKADVVEVVRCRDCTYFDKAIVTKKGFVICPASGMEITDDDFCSYGERRESDATD